MKAEPRQKGIPTGPTVLLAVLLALPAAGEPAAAQEVRPVQGRVLDETTGEPLPATNIAVLGTNRGYLSQG